MQFSYTMVALRKGFQEYNFPQQYSLSAWQNWYAVIFCPQFLRALNVLSARYSCGQKVNDGKLCFTKFSFNNFDFLI